MKPDRKNTTITVFDKPISERFSPNIRTENMVSLSALCTAMKYRFQMFVVNVYARKFLKGLYLPSAFIVIAESF